MLGVRGDDHVCWAGVPLAFFFFWDLESNSCRVNFGNLNGRGKSLRGERGSGGKGVSKEFGIDTSHRAKHAQGAWHLPCSTPRVPYCSTGGSGVSVLTRHLINRLIPSLCEP